LIEQSTKVANYYLKKGYTFSKVSPIQPDFFTKLEEQRQNYQGDNYYQQVDENQFYQREFDTKMIDRNAPMNLFDRRNAPVAKITLNNLDTQDGLNWELDVVDIYVYNADILETVAPEIASPKTWEWVVWASKSTRHQNWSLEIDWEPITNEDDYDGYIEFKRENMVPKFIGSKYGGLPKRSSKYSNLSRTFYKTEILKRDID